MALVNGSAATPQQSLSSISLYFFHNEFSDVNHIRRGSDM